MIDFRTITKGSKLYNFHSHTQYCDGRDTMESIVKSAIGEGFTHLGFTPHSPIPLSSPCNMKYEEVPLYISEFNRLKRLYEGNINLYISMEIDYIGNNCNATSDFYNTIELDYKLSSIHFIPSQSGVYVDIDGNPEDFIKKMANYFDNDIRYVVDTFYNQTINMIESGGFDIIGHFDKIGYNSSIFSPGIDSQDWYNKHIYRIIEAIKDNNLIVEINTKAYAKANRFFPNQRYFSLLKKYEIPIIVNSDVHFANLINAGRNEAFEYLKLK